MSKNGLAKNIRHYRKNKGLSQETLSEYMGVSRQAITKWENDISRPSSEHLIKLAELFEVNIDVLLDCDKQDDLADKMKITTGKAPWIFVGISVLCMVIYLIVSIRLAIFSIGIFICMFILCIPIQLFLHIYFTNSVNTNTFNGIAGFDNKIDYNISEVKKLLVQIDLHVGVTSTVYIFLLSVISCIRLDLEWLSGLLLILYIFEIIVFVIVTNFKMIERIYCKDEDKKRPEQICL